MANLAFQNTQTRSAQSFILSALRLVGSLRSGQNLSAAELTDSLQVANDLLDAWSADGTLVFVRPRVTQDQNGLNLTLVANKQTYLLGNQNGNEDFLLARPPRLERVSIMYSASQSTPVERELDMYDDVEWQQRVPNKTTTSLIPSVCYVETNYPDMQLNFWPIPTQANPVVLYLWQALTQFPNLQTKFSFPPAYARAIRFNLAVDLFAEFKGDLQSFPLIKERAAIYKGEIEAMNMVHKEARADEALIGAGGKMGNIFTGTANISGR